MSIFNIYWNNVGENLIPSFWRKTKAGLEAKIVPYVRSVLAPIQELSDTLYGLFQLTDTFLNYNGQHIALENYLNDTYDLVDRRIYITENNVTNQLLSIDLYLQGETDFSPISIYQQGETIPAPFSLYLQPETVMALNNFTINIPISIGFDSDVVTRQVKNYSEASKIFNIVTF